MRQNIPICAAPPGRHRATANVDSGGYRAPSACWLTGGGDRLGDVADDGVGTVAAGVQVGVVDSYRPASAAVGREGRGGEAGQLIPGQATRLGVVHGGEFGGGEHVEVGVQPPGLRQAGQRWWLHTDLDVLTTAELAAVDYPQPGNLTWDQ